jgi:hypothetical protein
MSSWIRTTLGVLVVACSGLVGCVGDATDVDGQTGVAGSALTAPAKPTTRAHKTGDNDPNAGTDTAITPAPPMAAGPAKQAEAVPPGFGDFGDNAGDTTGDNGGDNGGVNNGPPPPHPWTVPISTVGGATSHSSTRH